MLYNKKVIGQIQTFNLSLYCTIYPSTYTTDESAYITLSKYIHKGPNDSLTGTLFPLPEIFFPLSPIW